MMTDQIVWDKLARRLIPDDNEDNEEVKGEVPVPVPPPSALVVFLVIRNEPPGEVFRNIYVLSLSLLYMVT